jgi:hypothetical protein
MAGKNNPLFSIGGAETIDIETGESVPIEGGGFKMLPGPPGTCQWCHVKHDPTHPHNRDSLSYQMKFHAVKGRWPTWTDAMAHCSDEMKGFWRKHLVEMMAENDLEIPDDLK